MFHVSKSLNLCNVISHRRSSHLKMDNLSLLDVNEVDIFLSLGWERMFTLDQLKREEGGRGASVIFLTGLMLCRRKNISKHVKKKIPSFIRYLASMQTVKHAHYSMCFPRKLWVINYVRYCFVNSWLSQDASHTLHVLVTHWRSWTLFENRRMLSEGWCMRCSQHI